MYWQSMVKLPKTILGVDSQPSWNKQTTITMGTLIFLLAEKHFALKDTCLTLKSASVVEAKSHEVGEWECNLG